MDTFGNNFTGSGPSKELGQYQPKKKIAGLSGSPILENKHQANGT
jgi:hypothetical protein